MQKRAKNQSYFFTIDFLIDFECSIICFYLENPTKSSLSRHTGRVDTSVTECIPHRIPDVRLFRIRLFTKRIIQQLSVNTDIYFRPR